MKASHMRKVEYCMIPVTAIQNRQIHRNQRCEDGVEEMFWNSDSGDIQSIALYDATILHQPVNTLNITELDTLKVKFYDM